MTWLSNEVPYAIVAIDGYNLHRLDRPACRGGGVCIYSRADLPFRVRKDLERPGVKAIGIEISLTDKVYFCCVYRPPQEPIGFWEEFDDVLSSTALRGHRVVVAGDLNVDLSPSQASTNRQLPWLLEHCAGHDLCFHASTLPECLCVRHFLCLIKCL